LPTFGFLKEPPTVKTPSARPPRPPRPAARLPEPGDVIRYEFLWPEGHAQGRDSDKERPCGVVVSRSVAEGRIVFVVPITSRDPKDPRAIVVQAGGPLGLKAPGWIIPWAVNAFQWMGSDVREAPDPKGAFWRYGALSGALRERLAAAVAAEMKAGRMRQVARGE